jgi:Meckel syndrome type 1 protein
VEASKRVAREKAANRDAATASQRAASVALEKLSKRCDTAEQEVQRLRSELTAVKSALEDEKKRSGKQQQLSAAALQAANKRAEQFELKYESAHAEAVEERQRLLSYRAAAADLNRQLDAGNGAPVAQSSEQLMRSSTRQATPASVPRKSQSGAGGASTASPSAKAAYSKPPPAKAAASPPPAKASPAAKAAPSPAKASPAAKAAPSPAAKASPAAAAKAAPSPAAKATPDKPAAEAPPTPTPAAPAAEAPPAPEPVAA